MSNQIAVIQNFPLCCGQLFLQCCSTLHFLIQIYSILLLLFFDVLLLLRNSSLPHLNVLLQFSDIGVQVIFTRGPLILLRRMLRGQIADMSFLILHRLIERRDAFLVLALGHADIPLIILHLTRHIRILAE